MPMPPLFRVVYTVESDGHYEHREFLAGMDDAFHLWHLLVQSASD